MADTDLATTGKDVSVVITYDGAVVNAYEMVEFEVEPIRVVTRTKPLGTRTTRVHTENSGWKGRLGIETNRKDADELLDTLIGAEAARVPGALVITSTEHYRDGSSKTYTYQGVKVLSAQKRVSRDDSTKLTIEWETGEDRVAA